MKRSLTRAQAAELLRAASTLPPAAREAFFAAVDGRLAGLRRQLTDGDVNAAIITVLADASITTTQVFLCDAAPPRRLTMPRHDDDDDAFDERGLLKDGARTRVPMMFRDGMSDVQRAIAEDAARRRFDDSQAKHQPGPVFVADRSAARQAYEDAKAEAQDAWRNPAPDAVRGQQPGDVCTINGAPGHLNARLECVPDRQDAGDRRRRHKMTTRDPQGRETGTAEWEEEDSAPAVLPPRTMDAAEAKRIKKAAYEAMCAEDRDAWRKPLP